MSAPCKNCKSRFVGCHQNCTAYLANKAQYDAQKEHERLVRGAIYGKQIYHKINSSNATYEYLKHGGKSL
ncbi:MAG: hypothetical protein RR405_02505 [Clostridia bacterium]